MDLNKLSSDIQTLDVNDLKRLGIAPPIVKVIVITLAAIVVIALGAWFLVQPKFDELQVVIEKETQLKNNFDVVQGKAANREAYAEQLEEMQRTFKIMLRQLPNKTDIENLLVDLSQTSVASGLTVEYFKPDSEVLREFYAEYPIKISVTGNYHEFGSFVSGLSALPRIVTLSNISIKENKKVNSDSGKKNGFATELKMALTATTYRYVDD